MTAQSQDAVKWPTTHLLTPIRSRYLAARDTDPSTGPDYDQHPQEYVDHQ
jgi:hypothetical protein